LSLSLALFCACTTGRQWQGGARCRDRGGVLSCDEGGALPALLVPTRKSRRSAGDPVRRLFSRTTNGEGRLLVLVNTRKRSSAICPAGGTRWGRSSVWHASCFPQKHYDELTTVKESGLGRTPSLRPGRSVTLSLQPVAKHRTPLIRPGLVRALQRDGGTAGRRLARGCYLTGI
jgi:hypothetical protein